MRLIRLFPFLLLALVSSIEARVLSYAPVTREQSMPVVQSRDNRYFALIEGELLHGYFRNAGVIVLYDSRMEEKPRVVFPMPGETALIDSAALFEDDDETVHLLVSATIDSPASARSGIFYSSNAGLNWQKLPVAGAVQRNGGIPVDIGVGVVQGPYSGMLPANAEYPFVFLATGPGATFYSIDRAGAVHILLQDAGGFRLLGTNRERSRFLYTGGSSSLADHTLSIIDLSGEVTSAGVAPFLTYDAQGWIAADGTVFLQRPPGWRQSHVYRFREGAAYPVFVGETKAFAVPTHDYAAAWLLHHHPQEGTRLSRVDTDGNVVEQWNDSDAPDVEALLTNGSSTRLLIQEHKIRAMNDGRPAPRPGLIDPALAVWEIGTPAPERYDELFLIEGPSKGFLNLDVDSVAEGGEFYFDSGQLDYSCRCLSSGGADIAQEWGVVRSALEQRLVLPSVARLPGAYGSYWKTDIIVRNVNGVTTEVGIRFLPTAGSAVEPRTTALTLQARESRRIDDALLNLFGLDEGGGGAVFDVAIGHEIDVVSRTYSEDPEGGTFGMGFRAVDRFVGASARFPVQFSAALQTAGARANIVLTNVESRPAAVRLFSELSEGSRSTVRSFSLEPMQQVQVNDLGSAFTSGVLVSAPDEGTILPSVVVIDNQTNDPTHYPPDLIFTEHIIPLIGRVAGANGTLFRTDLYLYNASTRELHVPLSLRHWASQEDLTRTVTLPAMSSVVIEDAMLSLFGREGLGTLRVPASGGRLQVTSRIYTTREDGGTYGFGLPGINDFQTVLPGETLEIVGVTGGARFRTNLAIVDLIRRDVPESAEVVVEILDETGAEIDQFELTLPAGTGTQVLDLFRIRGLGEGPPAAVIRVTPRVGSVTAFATVLDNGTNDPSYLPAALASTE